MSATRWHLAKFKKMTTAPPGSWKKTFMFGLPILLSPRPDEVLFSGKATSVATTVAGGTVIPIGPDGFVGVGSSSIIKEYFYMNGATLSRVMGLEANHS